MRNAAKKNRQLMVRSYRRARFPATIAAVCALVSGGGPPAVRAQPAASLERVLEEIRAEIAPASDLRALGAIRMEGVVEMDGASVGRVVTIGRREPRAMRETLEIAGARQVTTLLGAEGWLEDANGSVRAASGDELAMLQLAHDLLFHRYLDGSSPEFDLSMNGRGLSIRPVGGGPERILEMDEGSRPRLLVQKQHGTEVRVTFEDWRLVEGIRFPFHVTQGSGDPRFDVAFRTTSVELLASLPENAIPRPVVGTAPDFTLLDPAAARDIPFRTRENLVLVEVEINRQRRGTFLLDTGAGATVLASSFAGKLGLSQRGKMEARGAGGSEAAAFVDVASLQLPGVELRDQTVVAMPLEPVGAMLGLRIDGILGYDFLSRFAVEIDYGRRRLAVCPSGEYEPREGARRVALRIEANVPRVEGSVEGKPRGSFLLDTGNSKSLLLHSPFVLEHGLEERTARRRAIAGIGGSETLFEIRIDELSIGEVVFRDVDALLSTSEQGIAAISEAIGNIGGGLFRGAVLAFDYSEGALWLADPAAISASGR